MADAAALAKELRTLLRVALPQPSSLPLTLQVQTPPTLSEKARIKLASMGIQLGDRVVIAGQKVGTLQFCGNTEFSGGLWAGVVLDKPEGKNDGSVAGIQYFTCQLKHVFAPLSKISKPLSQTPSASSSVHDGPEMRLGDRVLVAGQRTGVVHFYGKTSFAPHWLGIALDTPSGKNDGSVGGVRYFNCPPRHGVFAPPSRVQIHGSVDCLSELSSSHLTHPSISIRRSFSTSSAIAPPKETSRRNPVTSTLSGGSSSSSSIPRSSAGTVYSSDNKVRLHEGMQVLLNSANEMACIRYMGMADFAPGLWLGLELRGPKGKNDGSVGGRRYFTCRPGHGVLVRPSRVTYRGINGSRLVDENS
uniref:Si:dkeyp-47f9.4 n=1 Tax=Hippocampus comes TaxID=109280 RepID=A0A3Q3DC19_HIPCM